MTDSGDRRDKFVGPADGIRLVGPNAAQREQEIAAAMAKIIARYQNDDGDATLE